MDISSKYHHPNNMSTCPINPALYYSRPPMNKGLNHHGYLSVEALQRKIENDSQNIGFVIGKGLRETYDTTIHWLKKSYSSIKTNLKLAINWIQNAYASLKNFRKNHSVNSEDFDYALHETINAETSIEGYEDHFKKSYPQAIVLHANYFNNFVEKFADQAFLRKTERNEQFLNNLAKNHRVHNLVMFQVKDLCEIIEKAHQLGPIRFLKLAMHGESRGMVITDKNDDYFEDHIDIYDFYSGANRGSQDLSCLDLMDEGSIIILESCNTAQDTRLRYTHYSFPMSIQKLFALHAPQSKVFAPDFYTWKNSIVIKHDAKPTIQVYSQGLDSMPFSNPLGFLKIFLFLLDNPYLNEFVLLSPLKEVSAEKSDFCKEVLPYFSMKRFCDRAKVHPDKQKINQCLKEPKCNEAIRTLDYIHKETKNTCRK
jgi:hypothetical protein